MTKTKLFKDFLPVSSKEWKQKIQYDLKGADYNEKLVWESPEGIRVKPFYHQDEGIYTASVKRAKGHWNIAQSIYAGDAKKANVKAKEFLAKGAESLFITIPSDAVAIAVLLDEIDVSTTKIYCNFEFLSPDYIKKVLDFVGDASDSIYLNIDIIGKLAKTGNWFQNLEDDHRKFDLIAQMGATHTVSIDVGHYQNAGANMTQQLAYGLAHANEYLHHLANSKSVRKGQTFVFQMAAGSNYFFEIGKLRALRILWQTLAREYGVNEKCHIIATPTRRNKTLYDYNTNMLRTTTETMSAILGGADTVMNMPYDAIYHKNNEFGDRIAMNQLLLLKEESYFTKVENPAEGSYYIESLTSQLAQKALALFKDIERNGGLLKQLKAGIIQKKIKESAAKEQAMFNGQKIVLVGTNKYQNEMDNMTETMQLYPFVKTNPQKTLLEPIIAKRFAETIEQNRLKDE
ncbi:methylmalonyl-CoA mutase [Aggregatimonas sangjinii]|uniref:Methylmalonyl-CoA mutase n=1 Tax=Aggregatimonas sangjinii TaxID=2583587 RepID=A0A5B7SNQ9_9FLAO|nr:methylmalonyl-CoA mutase subunit beta [Aggregatimonas sangjinii]QCW98699.1 methylmalonyl-CoA mutase [Aggregatimonas sangjinii]